MGRSCQPTGRTLAATVGVTGVDQRCRLWCSSVRGVLASIAVALVAALTFASPATADAADQGYLDALNANGLACGRGPFACPNGDADLVQMGRSICRQLTRGNSVLSVQKLLLRQRPDVPPPSIAVLVGAAKAAYCAD